MGEMTYIEKTQNTLGKVIQRPTLSEKNLSRPPFRFIHDIVTQLIKKTGFFKDLFPPEMLDSKNVTEKDQKVKFLQAIIACTTLVYGKEITVKASSIVSGKEPENTNKLLQIIGKCILEKKSSDEAVEQLKNGGKKSEKSESKTKEDSRRKEKESSQEKEERRKSKRETDSGKTRGESNKPKDHKSDEKSSSKNREGSSRHRESSKTRVDGSKDRKSDRKDRERSERDRSKDKKSKSSEDKENRDSDRKSKRDRSEKRSKETPEEREIRKEAEREERRRQRKMEKSGRPPRPTSAKGDRRTAHVPEDQPKEPVEQDQSEGPARKMRERPTSARPAKRVKAPAVEDIPPPAVVNPNVIIDENDDDDDENDLGFDEQIDIGGGGAVGNIALNENESHGALVQDIIDSKNKIEKNSQKTRPVMSEAEEGKHKKRIEKIRSEIQQISRTAAPIGRVLDFIQEDMDSMENEFEQWTQELIKNQNIIKQGAKQNDASLQSLFDQLDQLDSEILAKRNEINSTKQKIYFNKNMIEKQVNMMLT